jgi:hypothetical protein
MTEARKALERVMDMLIDVIFSFFFKKIGCSRPLHQLMHMADVIFSCLGG